MSADGMKSLQTLLTRNDTITKLDYMLEDYYQDPVRWYLKENPIEPLLENNKIIAEKRQSILVL